MLSSLPRTIIINSVCLINYGAMFRTSHHIADDDGLVHLVFLLHEMESRGK